MSSLANQLANIAGGQVLDKKKKKKIHQVSLIYDPKEASTQDYETIYYDALDALRDLQVLNPKFKSFENSLFAETSINVDREVQTQEQNDLLDKAVGNFLSMVAPHINIQPALRALEWLVRRFQIHVHNTELLILTVISYYSSPVFVRVLDVVPTPLPQIFDFLTQSKKSAQNPPRNLMIRALTNDEQLYQLVSSHVLKCCEMQREYHGLLAFWSSFSIWTMVAMKEAGAEPQQIVERYLPVISGCFPLKKCPDAQVAAYMVLVVLTSQFRLELRVKEAAIQTIALNWTQESLKSGLACITQLVKGDEDATDHVEPVYQVLTKVKDVVKHITGFASKYNIERFVVVWALGVFQHGQSIKPVRQVLGQVKMSDYEIGTILSHAVKLATFGEATTTTQKSELVDLFDQQMEQYPTVVNSVLKQARVTTDHLELSLQSSLKHVQTTSTAIEQEDVSMEEIDESKTASPVDFDLLPAGNSESYLDINVDVSQHISLLSSIVSNHGKFDLAQFKLQSGSELSFLARIWISTSPLLVRAAALAKFIEIVDEFAAKLDYQALLPCLLMGLNSESEKIRSLSGSALAKLEPHYPMKKNSKIWALDSVYGAEDSEVVVFLNSDHVKTLLSEIVGPRVKECAMDGECIIRVVQDAYTKDKKLGEALWQFMYSHALGANIPQLKTVLLRLANRAGKNDARVFTPLLDKWVDQRQIWQDRCQQERVEFRKLEEQVVAVVTNGDKASLKFLESCLKSSTDLCNVAGEQVVDNWHRMRGDSQFTIIKFLVDMTVDDTAELDAMQTLNNVKINCNQFVSILAECQLEDMKRGNSSTTPASPSGGAVATVAKRRRRSSNAVSKQNQLQPGGELINIAERHLRKVTVVLELLERNKPDSNVELLTHLFTILRDLLSIGSETKLAVEYVQQVLGNCMVMVVQRLKQKTKGNEKYDSNAIRVDIVVDCIRTSTSPQVQNRFLLLVAELASLDREIVLHGVMPIFTFMGANTVRKDDEYSAHIIQHTVEKVIPALFESGRQVGDVDYILSSFATALTHIPRHRRVKMFSTLLRTIGVDISFYRFLMLMGVKYYESKTAHHSKEAESLVDFGVSLCRTFGALEQLTSVAEYLKVVQIVPLEEVDEESEFATSSFFKNAANYDANHLKMLKTNLYEYVGAMVGGFKEHSVQNLADRETVVEQCSKIIEQLLAAQSMYKSHEGIVSALFTVLTHILSVLPITDFVKVVDQLLQGVETPVAVKVHAITLLRTKFESEHVQDDLAQQAAAYATGFCKGYLENASHAELVVPCLDSLDVVVARFGSSLPDEELLALMNVVTSAKGLKSVNDEVYVTSVAVVNSLIVVLGAKMIGSFAKIVPVVTKRFEAAIQSEEDDEEDKDEDDEDSVQLASLALFAGMVKRIPAFMSSTLSKILELCFKSTVDASSRQRVLETVIESVEFKHSIAALASTWKFAVASVESVSLHLGVLDVVTESCRKKEFAPFGGALVDMFLEAFGVRAAQEYETNQVNRIETMCINSALKVVLKLNDKTFRPLFVRMIRWAFDGTDYNRLITFFKFVVKVLSTLKRLVTDYYGYLVDPVCELLGKLITEPSEPLKRYVLQSLTVSFQNDKDGDEFWKSQVRFDKVSVALIEQIPSIESNLGNVLVKAITALAEACVSHENNKAINELVTSHMKDNCSVNEKIWAIRTLKSLYSKLGEEWVSMLPQLVPLIAELLEDDNETVENEVRRELVPVVEEVLGESLDRYLT